MQNSVLRKILEAFKILFILVIKIEANVLLTRSRLNRKTRDYTARIMTLAEQYSVTKNIKYFFKIRTWIWYRAWSI